MNRRNFLRSAIGAAVAGPAMLALSKPASAVPQPISRPTPALYCDGFMMDNFFQPPRPDFSRGFVIVNPYGNGSWTTPL